MTKSKAKFKTKDQQPALTAVVIVKNEAKMIESCLDTLWWCDQVLVLDSGSTDKTAELAEKAGARVIGYAHDSMAELRNEALKQVKTEWLFYVDADERVTPTLAKEIMVKLETSQPAALRMARQNVHYGRIMQHGGWQHDWVTRVFNKENLDGWQGKIHESPQFKGQAVNLQSPLIHLTHRQTVANLQKTITWTPMEAELLHQAEAKPVKLMTILRKGIMEFLRRGIFQAGYKDGLEGWIEALVQGMNRSLVYIQLWEKQRSPSLKKTYQQFEEKIKQLWQQTS